MGTCMVKESIHGKTEECMKESTFMIRSMAMVFTDGPMAENTMVNGKTESSMEKVNMCSQIEIKEKEFGRMVIEANGPPRKSNIINKTVIIDLYIFISINLKNLSISFN